jgi:hypothetical protein
MSTPVTRYWRHIVRSGRWGEALASLTALREHVRCDPPPIDYQLRRIISDEPSRLVGAIHEAGFDAGMATNTTSTMWCADSGSTSPAATSPTRRRPTRCRPPNFAMAQADCAIDGSYATHFQDVYECLRQANGMRPQGH